MAKVIIFGVNDSAQLAHYYLTHDSEHEVVAFCVDAAYLPEVPTLLGLPVVSFEQVENDFPQHHCHFLAPMTAQNMNRVRADVFARIESKGFEFVSYVSSKATILSENIGRNCFILEDNTLQPFTRIEDNVVLWSGNHIGHHSRVAAHSFISSHVVVSGHCDIGEYCYLGVNSSLRDGCRLAEGSFVAMGAVVTRDTEAWGAYMGSPARSMRKRSTDIKIYHEVD